MRMFAINFLFNVVFVIAVGVGCFGHNTQVAYTNVMQAANKSPELKTIVDDDDLTSNKWDFIPQDDQSLKRSAQSARLMQLQKKKQFDLRELKDALQKFDDADTQKIKVKALQLLWNKDLECFETKICVSVQMLKRFALVAGSVVTGMFWILAIGGILAMGFCCRNNTKQVSELPNQPI